MTLERLRRRIAARLPTPVVSGPPPKRHQRLRCTGRGQLVFGENVLIGWPEAPWFHGGEVLLDARAASASIRIGDDVVIGNLNAIVAERTSIDIGARTLIGPRVLIVDSDFHGLAVAHRRDGHHPAAAVSIGADVLVGACAIVLKGVTVGDGAVIGAGAVVASDVAPGRVVVGNPSRDVGGVPLPDR
jgi:maltose O-acetyltransferase